MEVTRRRGEILKLGGRTQITTAKTGTYLSMMSRVKFAFSGSRLNRTLYLHAGQGGEFSRQCLEKVPAVWTIARVMGSLVIGLRC